MNTAPEAAAPAEPEATQVAAPAGEGSIALDEILSTPPAAVPPLPPAVAMRTARVVGVTGRRATLTLRGQGAPLDALVAPEVDARVIADALASGDAVLVETVAGELPVIVGVLLTQRRDELRLRARTIHIEGDDEVLLRSGRAAIRLRADGDIEVVGSRISAASRGLFRIVGRILRLN